ncbi:hypothetical protein CL616_01430 [archaeon]|nr:hypothetical protein [archaeon]
MPIMNKQSIAIAKMKINVVDFLNLKYMLKINALSIPKSEINIRPFGPPVYFSKKITPTAPRLAPIRS